MLSCVCVYRRSSRRWLLNRMLPIHKFALVEINVFVIHILLLIVVHVCQRGSCKTRIERRMNILNPESSKSVVFAFPISPSPHYSQVDPFPPSYDHRQLPIASVCRRCATINRSSWAAPGIKYWGVPPRLTAIQWRRNVRESNRLP